MKTQEKIMEMLFGNRNGLSFREIARREGCDPRTAKKYIEHPELLGKPRQSAPRPSLVDGFRDQIEATLCDAGANHRATHIYDQLVRCGYSGGYELVKRAVRQVKGRKQRLAYIRFETMPGFQAQVDFGEFFVTQADGSSRRYYLFSMVLGYSRKLFGCLLERCDLPSFLEAHMLAFEHLGGVPEEILYDRMRNVYIRDICDTVAACDERPAAGRPLFTQSLMTLAVHYGFAPRVAPAYAAWVKGKVERPFDYVRESWWRGYEFRDLGSANADLGSWLALKEARVHGTTHERVDVRFDRERPRLRALPPSRCDISERLTRLVHKDCTISVEANWYLVPHTLVGEKVTVRVAGRALRVFADGDLIDCYAMPEGKGHVVGLEKGYYEALLADREMQERKFGNGGRRKGKDKGRARMKRTISPTVPRYPVDVEPITFDPIVLPCVAVERRSMAVYAQLSGEVSHA